MVYGIIEIHRPSSLTSISFKKYRYIILILRYTVPANLQRRQSDEMQSKTDYTGERQKAT